MNLVLEVEQKCHDELAGLNQKPSDIRYRASKMAPRLCTMCWSGKRLDRSVWSMRSILGGRCLLNKMARLSCPGIIDKPSPWLRDGAVDPT